MQIAQEVAFILFTITFDFQAEVRRKAVQNKAYSWTIWCEAFALTAQMQGAPNAKGSGLIRKLFQEVFMSLDAEVQNPVRLICAGPLCLKLVHGENQERNGVT